MIKKAKIKKIKDQYRVVSESGKNQGTYDTFIEARNRLIQIESFKKKFDKNKANDNFIDLSEIKELSYSCIMRELRKICNDDQIKDFMKIYKKIFDRAYIQELSCPDKIALQETLINFNKMYKIKLPKNLVKNAAIAELGDSELVGKYIADIIKFICNRFDSQTKTKFVSIIKKKVNNISELELSNKEMPDSAAIGQSITFIKHVLFNQNSKYIQSVLNAVSANL